MVWGLALLQGAHRLWQTVHFHAGDPDHPRNCCALGFILISLLYFKKFGFTGPLQTALLFLGWLS